MTLYLAFYINVEHQTQVLVLAWQTPLARASLPPTELVFLHSAGTSALMDPTPSSLPPGGILGI